MELNEKEEREFLLKLSHLMGQLQDFLAKTDNKELVLLISYDTARLLPKSYNKFFSEKNTFD